MCLRFGGSDLVKIIVSSAKRRCFIFGQFLSTLIPGIVPNSWAFFAEARQDFPAYDQNIWGKMVALVDPSLGNYTSYHFIVEEEGVRYWIDTLQHPIYPGLAETHPFQNSSNETPFKHICFTDISFNSHCTMFNCIWNLQVVEHIVSYKDVVRDSFPWNEGKLVLRHNTLQYRFESER